jgi:hypothetical protein
MKHIVRLLAFALVGVLASAPAALAGKKFSEADIKGPYGFAFDGTVGVVPVSSVGQFTADGSGNLTGSRVLNAGGGSVPQTFTCTYTVNDDGTGHASCVVTPGGPESFDFVLVDKGKEAYFIGSGPGVLIRGVAKPQ